MQAKLTTILVATRESTAAHVAERITADLASRSAATIHLIRAHGAGADDPRVREVEGALTASARRLADVGGWVGSRATSVGTFGRVIGDRADTLDADLVIVEGGDVERPASAANALGALVPRRPMLAVRDDAAWPPRRIVVGHDGSPGANRAAILATMLRTLYATRLEFVHIGATSPLGQRDWAVMASRHARYRDGPLAPTLDALTSAARCVAGGANAADTPNPGGDACAVLLDVATREEVPTLIVAGCLALDTPEGMLLGSAMTTLLRSARCPVLLVPDAPRRRAV